jgi:hypothetical protein
MMSITLFIDILNTIEYCYAERRNAEFRGTQCQQIRPPKGISNIPCFYSHLSSTVANVLKLFTAVTYDYSK